jgi:hypothetical protein
MIVHILKYISAVNGIEIIVDLCFMGFLLLRQYRYRPPLVRPEIRAVGCRKQILPAKLGSARAAMNFDKVASSAPAAMTQYSAAHVGLDKLHIGETLVLIRLTRRRILMWQEN